MKSIKKIIKIVILVIGIVFALLIAIGMLVDGDILKIEENDVSIEYTPKDIGNYVNEEEIEDSLFFLFGRSYKSRQS